MKLLPESTAWLTGEPLDVLAQARDGVLFVAEIATLNKQEQKGLQFVLSKLEKSNVRLVCAASDALPAMVEQGGFDAGRLNVLQLVCGHKSTHASVEYRIVPALARESQEPVFA